MKYHDSAAHNLTRFYQLFLLFEVASRTSFFYILSCAPITGILHAAAVPDGNKKNHSMFYAVFVSDFCELNEIIPKPIRILWNLLVLCVKVRMGLSITACIEFIFYWILLIELHFCDGAWKRPKLTNHSKVLEICIKMIHRVWQFLDAYFSFCWFPPNNYYQNVP